jgi:DNA-binding MarR family transcriptional regulator
VASLSAEGGAFFCGTIVNVGAGRSWQGSTRLGAALFGAAGQGGVRQHLQAAPFTGRFFDGTVVKPREFMKAIDLLQFSLTDRQLAALLAIEERCAGGNQSVSPGELAVTMNLKGLDVSRVARSLLDQLKKKNYVHKNLRSEGKGRGIVSYYSLTLSGKQLLSKHHSFPLCTKKAKPVKPIIMPSSENYDGVVYFIGNADSGPIKIGFTSSEEPSNRLRSLQTASPVELKVLGYINGGVKVEGRIHSFLHLHRLKGEWFERDAALSILNHLTPKNIFTMLSDGDVFIDQILNIAYNIDHEEDETIESLAPTIARYLLWELASRFRNCHTKHPIPFLSWLLKQVDREDATGDLARDAKGDPDFPCIGSLTDYFDYLYSHLSPEITRTIVESWIECQQVVCQLNRFE